MPEHPRLRSSCTATQSVMLSRIRRADNQGGSANGVLVLFLGGHMSANEKSPDYGKNSLTWQQWVKGALVLFSVVAFVTITFLV